MCALGCKKHRVLKTQSKPYQLLAHSKKKAIALKVKLKYIDSAFCLSQQYPVDSLALAIISKKAVLHLQLNQLDSFFFYNKRLLKKSQNIDNKRYYARSAFNLGYYFEVFNNMPDSAFYYYHKAKNNFIISGDTIKAGETLIRVASLENVQSNFFNAKASLTEALHYLSNSADKKYIASLYSELATNNHKLLNHSDAIKYYNKAIEITSDKVDINIYKNNLAFLYIEQNKYSNAISILEKLISDSLLEKGTIQYARVLHNLTYAQWLGGKNNVLPSFLEALNIRKTKNDTRGLIQSHTNLAEYYTKTNPKKASKYLDTVLQLSKVLKSPEAETDALKLYMELYPKQVAYKDRYIFLKDSLYTQELKVKTQFAKMQYDDEQEKAKIVQLEKETAKKKVALANQKTQKVLYLSLSGVLLVAGVSLYYALKQRHKKEKLKEIYNTEQLISKRLHDELSNDIYGLMATIEQNPNAESPYLLDSLEKIYGQTRTISHDNRTIATGAAFPEELKDTLGAFYNDETTVIVKGFETIDWKHISDYKCIAIHRTLKEFMVNMKKHSEATLVAVNFKGDGKWLNIIYTDNGIGMDLSQKFGVGLNNTVSRIQGVNGKIKFDSENNYGTKINISIPY